MAFNAGERANRNPEVFDYRAAAEERLREQFSPQSQPGFKLGPTFGDATDRAVRDRDNALPDEAGKVTYTRGVPNRSPSRFAGENQEAIALLGMDRGQTFFEAASNKKNKPAQDFLAKTGGYIEDGANMTWAYA